MWSLICSKMHFVFSFFFSADNSVSVYVKLLKYQTYDSAFICLLSYAYIHTASEWLIKEGLSFVTVKIDLSYVGSKNMKAKLDAYVVSKPYSLFRLGTGIFNGVKWFLFNIKTRKRTTYFFLGNTLY